VIVILVDPRRNLKLPELDFDDEQFTRPLLEAAHRRGVEVTYLKKREKGVPDADLYVSAHPNYAYGWKARVHKTVILFHGLGDSELGGFLSGTRSFLSNRINIPTRLWRGWLVPGEYFAKGYPYYLRKRVKVVGFPKLDLYFSEDAKKIMENVRTQCNLELPFANTVIYAPTFWPSFSLRVVRDATRIGKRLIEASQLIGFNLIIKTHANVGRNGYGLELLRLMDKHRGLSGINCLIPPGKTYRGTGWLDNIIPLFWFGDVLVSDYSSTLREFMITNKPSVQVLSPSKSYKPEPGVYHTELRQLAETLSKAFDRIDDPREERARCVKHYMYKADGHSSDRAIDALFELMDTRRISTFFHCLTSKAIERVRLICDFDRA
jgi:hypothetical protein